MLASSARISSPSHLPPNPAAHVVQFYTNDEFLLEGLGNFIGDALEDGESAIAVATTAHLAGIRERLLNKRIDVNEAVNAGRYLEADAHEELSRFVTPHGIDRRRFFIRFGSLIRRVEKAAEKKFGRVFVFGEMVALLCADGRADQATALERLWNDLARTHFFYLRCAYPARNGPTGEAYSAICAEHTTVMPTSL